MTDIPQTRYANHGGSHIAYQVLGDGPTDIVLVRLAMNNVELQWEEPRFAAFMTRLASSSRLMVFDPRGVGLSDPLGENAIPTMDDWAEDILGVMDAVGSERASIVALSASAMRAIPFVATHPDRASSLVLVSGAARLSQSNDYPHGRTREEYERTVAWAEAGWGSTPQPYTSEDEVLTPAQMTWLNRYRRLSTSPGMAALIYATAQDLDVRHILGVVSVPTLVIDHGMNRSHGRYLADHIRDAERVEVPGQIVHGWPYTDPDAVADEIERFVTGAVGVSEIDRVLATVLFTDIVESTPAAVAAGDRGWRDTLDALDRLVASEVSRFRGRIVKFTGDGHLATFDGPGRAIRCSAALNKRSSELGITLRAGLHTGEVEVRGEDIGGIAVNIARRVCDAAQEGCVFVSSTVPPLVAGSPIEFIERGQRELKGVPGQWQLYEVKP